MSLTAASLDQNQNDNVFFSAVSNRNAQLMALYGALPPRTGFLPFFRDTAIRAQYQASRDQNQDPIYKSASGAGAGSAGANDGALVRWSTTMLVNA